MQKYIQENKILIVIQIMMHIAVWTYSSIGLLILSKYYLYTDAELSIIQNSFIIGIILSSAYQNINLNKRIKYNKTLLYSMLFTPIVLILKFIWTEFDFNHYAFSVLHLLEGVGYGLMSVIVGHFIKNILLNNHKNGSIYSYIVSSTYLIKTLIPIIVSYYFIIENHENYIFLYGAGLFILNAFIIFWKRKNIFNRYQRLITKQKNTGNVKKNITFKESLLHIALFLKDKNDRKYKIHYIYSLFANNMLRPFYDLYAGLLLINYYNFTLTETITVFSFMVLGQASQFMIGSLSDKIHLYKVGLIGMSIKITMFTIFFYLPDIFTYGILPYALFYILGFSRTFYAAYDYKLNNNLIKKGYTVNNISFVQMFFGETGHYFSYAIFAIFLMFGFSIHDLTYVAYTIALSIFTITLIFDRKNFNSIH